MPFVAAKIEPLVFDDVAAERSAALVWNQAVLAPPRIGKKVFRSQSLHAVIFEQRAVQRICTGLQHSIGDKSAALSVLRRKVVCDDSEFLNGLGRNRSYCALSFGPAAALS